MQKKLTQKQLTDLWGDGGPYSQVNLIEEERVLDDGVSRVFLRVEADINPTTFRIVKKNLADFKDDEEVQAVMAISEYTGLKDGYRCYFFNQQIVDEKEDRAFARPILNKACETVLRMHKYVIKEYVSASPLHFKDGTAEKLIEEDRGT
jgi:hypothetical protein